MENFDWSDPGTPDVAEAYRKLDESNFSLAQPEFEHPQRRK
ncbi:hypothetical protein ACFL4P_02835 [Gemmatimonadota bacterium]